MLAEIFNKFLAFRIAIWTGDNR